MKKYDEISVVRALSKNPDVTITNKGNLKVVEVVKNSQWCGNGTWGKIDFLVNHCGYTYCSIDLNKVIADKQAEKAAKKQAAKDARNARNTRNKVTINGVETDIRDIMKLNMAL